ncbi:MAG: ABC transporter permease [Firmicutes bacterium]|nr:ABC transporter permease [Bacillota bacterium]
MFFRLGLVNIVRQLERSALALLSLAIAAFSLTHSLAISLGYPAQAFANYRHYLGGDTVVYPTRIMGNPNQNQRLELHRIPNDAFSTLTLIYPHLTREGFLAPTTPILRPFSPADMQELATHPQVRAVDALYRMPGWWQDNPASLRAVPPDSKLWQYQTEQLSAPTARATIPVWLNSRQNTAPLPPVGSELDLRLPRIGLTPAGSLQYDANHTLVQRVVVAGYYEVPTRVVSWPGPDGGDFLTEQGYLDLNEVWLLEDDWQELWRLTTDNLPPVAGSLGLQVTDMSILEAIVGQLQIDYPEWTIISAPNLAKQAEAESALDSFQRAPKEYWAGRSHKPQHAFPIDVSRTLAGLIYLNAGLLMAARMLTGAAARRKEIGILKALGARRRDILLMALTEAVVLCLIGSTIGFAIAYPAALFQQISNGLAWGQILRLLAKNYGIILGQTLTIGVIFGLLPAWRLAKLTVNEVLRA